MISFLVEKINKNEIPLETIAKFFLAHGVGYVEEIHVVPFYIIQPGELIISDTYVRLYVHVMDNGRGVKCTNTYEKFHSNIVNGENLFQITDNNKIKVSLSKKTLYNVGKECEMLGGFCPSGEVDSISRHVKTNRRRDWVSNYKFSINLDTWGLNYPYTREWNINLVSENKSCKQIYYTNINNDIHNSYAFIENLYRKLRNISKSDDNDLHDECQYLDETSRRIDILNPIYDYSNKYTSSSGAIGFTQEEYEDYYGFNWRHYWHTSKIWEKHTHIINSSMKVRIELTLGPYSTLDIVAIHSVTNPITRYIDEIHYISEDNYDQAQKSVLFHNNYYTAYLDCEFSDIHFDDYTTIKNYLLNIEHICEIIKPNDKYISLPRSKIYTSFT